MDQLSGQDVVPADFSKTLQVVCCGFSRTATVSMSIAMQILLKGPVGHGGSTSLRREPELTPHGTPAYIKKWISIMEADPIEDKNMIKDTLRSLTAGYLAIADCPGILFSGELAELYPDAIFICTTRDPECWFSSWIMIMETTRYMVFIGYLLWPLPTMRYLAAWLRGGKTRSSKIYNEGKEYNLMDYETGIKHLEKHTEYLKRIVPASRLHFFDVKDGWGPLCKLLHLPAPDVPFPHGNDKKAVELALKGFIKKAILRWLAMFACTGLVVAVLIGAWMRGA